MLEHPEHVLGVRRPRACSLLIEHMLLAKEKFMRFALRASTAQRRAPIGCSRTKEHGTGARTKEHVLGVRTCSRCSIESAYSAEHVLPVHR